MQIAAAFYIVDSVYNEGLYIIIPKDETRNLVFSRQNNGND